MLLSIPKRIDTLNLCRMSILMENLGRNILCFLFKMNFPFQGAQLQSQRQAAGLHSPSCPWACSSLLEEKSSESGPGVGCGWLSKLGNVLVITFYCCLHFNFQPVFLLPASYLTRTANLILASFLQKHLTLCKNLASISLLLPQTRIISISRQHCQTAACIHWALLVPQEPPFPGQKGSGH